MINSRFYKLFSDEDACMKAILRHYGEKHIL